MIHIQPRETLNQGKVIRRGEVIDVAGAMTSSGLLRTAKPFDDRCPLPSTKSPLLSEALTAYQSERQLPPKTYLEFRASVRRFLEIVDDKPIGAISKADARAFKERLLQLPRMTPRRLKGARLEKII